MPTLPSAASTAAAPPLPCYSPLLATPPYLLHALTWRLAASTAAAPPLSSSCSHGSRPRMR